MPMSNAEADAVAAVAHELRGLAAMMELASQSMDEAERHAMGYCCERVEAAHDALSDIAESALTANAAAKAAPYEDGSFEPEPDGEAVGGSHLDAVGPRGASPHGASNQKAGE